MTTTATAAMVVYLQVERTEAEQTKSYDIAYEALRGAERRERRRYAGVHHQARCMYPLQVIGT